MKRILELRIYKSSFDPLNDERKIGLFLFSRYKIATWTYSNGKLT